MIEARSVTKSFDGLVALDALTMKVPRGAIYGLVGPNGAGKSTLIRNVMGIYRPDSGEVLVGGESVYENPGIKSGMAYIPDDVFFFTQATIGDMMSFYKGVYPGFSKDRYEKLMDAFSLSGKTRMKSLSKGMQKQAAFILALSCRPRLLVMDEPVDGLDPVMRRQVWGLLMSDVAETQMTVLVSSHNLRELEDVCDWVGIMSKGKMLLERSLSELQENAVKVQIALPEGAQLPEDLDIMHRVSTGKLQTLIIRGDNEAIASRLATSSPLFMDMLPLSLEEIFIYELGGEHYEVKDVIL
jgi:ABC-2 type transport system ATP-binding protein